jgi:hypothetical protein
VTLLPTVFRIFLLLILGSRHLLETFVSTGASNLQPEQTAGKTATCFSSNPQKETSLNNKRNWQKAPAPDHTCKDEVGLIADYLTGQLDPVVLAAFERHLGQCPDCKGFLNTYKKTIAVTKLFLKTQPLTMRTQPLRFPSKTVGLLDTFFWLHLFTVSADLMTG